MTVYHINKGIGMSSSGIEYAQKYRFDLVKDFPEKQYFVFCDYIYSNYTRFTDNIGIDMSFTLNAYKFLARQENHHSTFTVDDFLSKLAENASVTDFTRTDDGDRAVDFVKNNVKYKVWLITDGSARGYVDRVDVIISGRLQEVWHYSDRLTSIDYYSGKGIFSRYFYDEAGVLSMRQFLDGNKIRLTLLDDGKTVLQGEYAFYLEFFKRLNFGKNDLIILDRNKDVVDAMFPVKHDSTFVVVVHAEHFSQHLTDETWTLWNNYYEYVFVNHQLIDYYITSTDKQTARLKEQFAREGHPESKVLTIPVGTVARLSDGEQIISHKYKLMTASRLAAEKHIDVLVKAVAEAKQSLPQLEFHIYGDGGLRKSLSELIESLSAQDYIILEGHKHLEAEYEKYGGYLTASGSEGFGLTILEALGACLPIIGLAVDYGNTEFVKPGVNGYLLSRGTENEQVKDFAAAIVKLTEKLDYQRAIEFSGEEAKAYLSKNVAQKWRHFYDLVLGDQK